MIEMVERVDPHAVRYGTEPSTLYRLSKLVVEIRLVKRDTEMFDNPLTDIFVECDSVKIVQFLWSDEEEVPHQSEQDFLFLFVWNVIQPSSEPTAEIRVWSLRRFVFAVEFIRKLLDMLIDGLEVGAIRERHNPSLQLLLKHLVAQHFSNLDCKSLCNRWRNSVAYESELILHTSRKLKRIRKSLNASCFAHS